MVPSKSQHEPGGQSTSRDPPTQALLPTAQGPGSLRHRAAPGPSPRASPPAWPRSPAPGSALSVAASAPEEGDVPDFFAKHHLNFVTSKAAAALPGAVYIALWLLLPAQSSSPRARCRGRLPESIFCVLAKLAAELLLHSCHTGRPGQMFCQQPGRLAGPAPRARRASAGAADRPRPSQCTALLRQLASRGYE